MENILPILIADAPEALTELCGVNLLERLLRILQRLGFRRAIVFSTAPEIIGPELAKRSWAREQVIANLVPRENEPLTPQFVLEQSPSQCFLIVLANIYCDARLLASLCAKQSPAALVDSDPPEFAQSLIRNPCGPALVTRDFLFALSRAPFFEELKKKIDNREIDIIDAAEEDDYIVNMRRRVRPVCFPAPSEQNRRLAERIILDSAQNGTLDLPAYIHGPIETAIISLLCKTRITPNQITIGGFVIGCSATAAFVVGRVGLGILAALIFGIVDGLDGKQSRVKIETTERGKLEHHLDHLIENSWWLAIGFHLWRSGQFPNVFYFLALLIASHLLTEFAKRRVKIARGRLLDDVAPFDRAFRLIAARRNVYVWILACGFLLDALPQSYAVICGWAAFSAAVHLVRSIWICDGAVRRFVGIRS
ncbi:MAG TPA: CDP-alcohol phosphatidyltransferase family protein [Candidatus Dormibacteraeota bacterium]|nr:CDP-alcohol phosphatidyltransferase family protein [Candidatus Dormibacteraeota bacterium]